MINSRESGKLSGFMWLQPGFWANPGWWVIVLMATTCVALLALNAATHQVVTANMSEADGYFAQAEKLLQGDPYLDYYRPPLYVVFIVFISLVFHVRTFVAGMLISSMAASLLVGLTFVLAQRLLPRRYALLAAWLVAIDSLIVFHGLQVSTDALFAVFALLVLVLSVAWLQGTLNRNKLAFAIGLALGAAYLTRYTALFLIPVIWYAIGVSQDSWRVKLKHSFWIGGVFIMTTLPWLIYNTAMNGSPFANDNWRNFAFAVVGNGHWENYDSAQAGFTGFVDILIQAPMRVLQTWGQTGLSVIKAIPLDQTSSPVLAIFLPIGLVLFGHSRINRLLIIYSLASVLLVTFTFVYIERLLMPALPVLIVTSLAGLAWVWPRLLKWRLMGQVAVLALLVCILIMPWIRLPIRVNIYLAAQPITEVKMLDWLTEQKPAADARPIRVVSMFYYASDFVLHPNRMQNVALPSWFQREFYYGDQFKQLLNETVKTYQVQYVLLSDRLTYGIIESGQVNAVLSTCWSLVREDVDFTGKTRLYRRTCNL